MSKVTERMAVSLNQALSTWPAWLIALAMLAGMGFLLGIGCAADLMLP